MVVVGLDSLLERKPVVLLATRFGKRGAFRLGYDV
jgi:hypothetical protein